jgi:hypothetical protein
MKRSLWISMAGLLASCAAVFAVGALQQAINPKPELPSLLPEGALLSIEARDFSSLLRDWKSSNEKRAWLASGNYAAFSNSRLNTRLAQAQNEFSAAAGLPTDESLLDQVVGKQSCLALYDIGNLEFVYITRMDKQWIENTPLWQQRSHFEQRSEAGSTFFVRKDEQSSRVAAFAVKDGWLILATRQDLLAGVLDRFAGIAQQNLANEAWFAEAVKQAPNERGDLRMVMNLEKIVRAPHFRSYWIQQNITEMKQYVAAISDLYRSSQSYREERVLVRRSASATVSGDIRAITAIAPENAAYYTAQASPDPANLLAALRSDLLEIKPEQTAASYSTAPSAATAENAGSTALLETFIDRAPVAEQQSDAYAPLRALLVAQQPEASLEVFSSRPPSNGVFVSLQTGFVVSAPRAWDESAVCLALTQALEPNLTAGKLGLHWEKRSSASGEYLALDGALPLYLSASGNQLLLVGDSILMEELLARRTKSNSAAKNVGVTHAALFRHTHEQGNYRRLMAQLDLAGHRAPSDPSAAGESLAFFSGNVESLSDVFSKLDSESIEESDQGAKVLQTVTYQWAR